MAAVKTTPAGPFLGIDNRSPDYALSASERGRKVGDYLRNAINLDLTNAGTLKRRPGTEREVESAHGCHSLWCGDGHTAYYVDGEVLYQFPRTQVRTGLTPGMRASFCDGPLGQTYWSNGIVLERIADGVSSPVGVPVPNPAPVVSASAGGSLTGGVYQVAFTAVSASDEESGATWPVQVEVPDNGVISVSGMSGRTAIYISPANGDLLFWAATTEDSTAAFQVAPHQGPQLQTFGMRPLPAGQIVRWFGSRLLVASGQVLFYSEPSAPGLHNPSRGYIPFPARITIVRPCENGVFVVADKTYWLAGNDIDAIEIVREALPYGAVEGTDTDSPIDKTAWWFSDRGLVVGNQQGEVRNVQEDRVAVGGAAAGASMYVERDGMRQVVASLFGAEVSNAAATSFMEAEIIRKESMQ